MQYLHEISIPVASNSIPSVVDRIIGMTGSVDVSNVSMNYFKHEIEFAPIRNSFNNTWTDESAFPKNKNDVNLTLQVNS